MHNNNNGNGSNGGFIEDDQYFGPDRREPVYLSSEQIEVIADRAAEKAIAKVTDQLYISVGRAVLTKIIYSVGIIWAAIVIWLSSKGYIKF